MSGTTVIRRVAKWNGRAWEEVGGGADDYPNQWLMFSESGSSDVLMAADFYRLAGGAPEIFGLGRRDGVSWTLVGGGLWSSTPGRTGTGWALAAYDDNQRGGDRPALFVGGSFHAAGSVPARNIARWDGENWSRVGELGTDGVVHALCVFDAGDGPMLYVGGSFQRVGGPSNRITAPRLARWDGKEWSAVPGWTAPGGGNVRAMAVFDDDGSGPNKPALFIAGFFFGAAGTNPSGIIKWDGQRWDDMNGGLTGSLPPVGRTLHVFDDDGDGPNPGGLHVGGAFPYAGGQVAQGLDRWGCPLTPPCLADCDVSTGFGVLDVFDFLCFLNRFHAGAPYACDCDVSTGHGVCDIFDFLRFGQRFQRGCP